MKYIFAGDRDIAVGILEDLIQAGFLPSMLLLTEDNKSTHSSELIKLANLPEELVIKGKDFELEDNIETMKSLDVDYIIGIHFPYIIRQKVLDVPKIGFLNLHPAYLPFNRGWHTPSWAILEGTPAGATLHFMSSDLDLGDIIAQEKVVIGPDDTANTLYRKLKSKERELFRASIPMITSLQPKRIPQKASEGTSHKSKELYNHSSREIKMDAIYQGQDLLKIIRGFTTNDFKEAAYFEEDGMKYYLQLTITPEIE